MSSRRRPDRGKRPEASSSSRPTPMSSDNYTMTPEDDSIGFTLVTRSRARAAGITIRDPLESSTPPPSRPSASMLRPPTTLATPSMRPSVSIPSSSRGSSIPTTYSNAVVLDRFQPRPEIKSYFLKGSVLQEPLVEPEYESSNLREIVNNIYPPGFLFSTEDILKTRRFYEFILVDTKSAEITHIPSKDDPSKIAYSKLKILKVMSPTYWNQAPHTEKSFSKTFIPQTFSYYDYQKAWTNVLWYQNFEHSWFIQFCQNAQRINYPFWFGLWWSKFGLTEDILPVPIQESYYYFSKNIFKNSFHPLLRFSIYFQIPWILTWNFKIETNSYEVKMVFKTIKIKWWEKYTYTHANLKKIKEWFGENPQNQDFSSRRNQEFLNSKAQLLAALAQTSSEADFQKILQVASTSVHSGSSSSTQNGDDDQEGPYDLNDPFLDSQPPM